MSKEKRTKPSKTPREIALDTAEQKRKFISGQGAAIEKDLNNMGLEETVTVREGTTLLGHDTFNDTATIGLVTSGTSGSYPYAFFASTAAAEERRVKVVMVAPSADKSGLYTDKNGTIATDSFWIAEKAPDKQGDKTVITHHKTGRPIHLDEIMVMTGGEEQLDPALEAKLTRTEKAFGDSNEDKHTTKQTLEALGILLPRGTFLPATDSRPMLEEAYRTFVESIPEGKHLVIKPNNGVSGDDVIMGDPHSAELKKMAEKKVIEISKEYNGALIEERVDPPPQPALAALLNEINRNPEGQQIADDQVDWNMRILTTTGKNPEVIDGEIRFKVKNEAPVNVSTGAQTARLETIDDPELIEESYKTATNAVAALYDASYHQGDPPTSSYWTGVDIIINENKQPIVLEIQPTGGGFSSLTKIDKAPLKGIQTTYLADQEKTVFQKIKNRQPIDPTTLNEIQPVLETKLLQYESFVHAGEYKKAQTALMDMRKDYRNQFGTKAVIDQLALLAEQTGDYSLALGYITELQKTYYSPDYFRYRQDLIRARNDHRKKKR
jgi:hypothetical protein